LAKNRQPAGIQPLQPPWKNILLHEIKNAEESIYIITPILKKVVIKWITDILLDSPPENPFTIRIMTRLNEEALIDGVSDLEALEMLSNLQLGPQFKLEFRGVENLHANVYIFDQKKAFISSAGLSQNALSSNLEYGFVITDSSLVDQITTDFDNYWSKADELKLPDFRYFIAQIQEHDTSVDGFLRLGTSVQPMGTDLEDIGPIDGETLAKKYISEARDHEDMGELEEALKFYNKALVANPNNIDILRDKAVLLRDELKREEEALETYNKIISIEPKDERANLLSGIILTKLHRYWDALIKLDVATQENPGNGEGWYWKSEILRNTPGRKEDALLCLDEVIKIDPNYEKAWFFKALILSEDLERYSEADRCFNTVTRINPKNEEAWFKKGLNLFHNLNRPLDAIKCFDRMTKENKKSAKGWFYKGLILTSSYNKNEEARQCFNEAIKLDLEYIEALYSHGILLYDKLSKTEDAKKSLEKILEFDESNEDALFALGMLYGKGLNDPAKALDSFLRALRIRYIEEEQKTKEKERPSIKFTKFAELLKYLDSITLSDPKNALAWYEKGAILDRIYSRFDDALKCFDEATKLNTDLKDSWYDKGVILFSVHGRNEEAIKCLNKAISLDKNDENAWYIKGKALMDDQRFEDALACFEKVIKINPKNAYAYENIAKSLINLSRLKDAIKYFDKAIDLDKYNPVLWYNKGNVYLSLRQYPEALKCYKNALNINPSHELSLKNFEMYSDKNNWV